MSIRKMTFSLASLIIIFALASMPAMAQTLSATWSTDLTADGATTPPASDSGWAVTLAFATAPATGSDPTATATNAGSITVTPAANGTVTSFTFNVALTTATTDATVTVAGAGLTGGATFRRVSLMNARDLAATSIALPKLKSITAPENVNQFFDAVITFEAPAAAAAGPPAVAEIGPSDGLVQGDVSVTGGSILSFTANSDSMYTVVVNPNAEGTPVVVALGTTFPHMAPAQPADATVSVTYDTTAPILGTANTDDGPQTLLVNNRKPPAPDQWGPGNFDFLFTLADGTGSGVDAASIMLEDNQNPHVLMFSNVGSTTVAGQYAATVSTRNVDIEAGTVVTVLITVSDKAGNEATLTATQTITLAAKTMTEADTTASFTSATPATGGSVAQGGTIALVFGTDPGTVTVTAPTTGVTVSGTGTMRTLTIAADQAAGALSITITWGTSGTQTLAYTITAAAVSMPGDAKEFTFPAESHTVITHSGGHEGLPAGVTPMMWADMPDLENLLYTGGTIVVSAADANFDHDGDATTDMVKPALRNLVITEVMWARNLAEVGTTTVDDHQWIEVYNNLKVPVTASISAKQGQPALGAPSGHILVDRLSNVVGARWQLTGLGQNGYDDGMADNAKTDFISMFRKERGKDGHVKGHWAQSSETYLPNHKGTPGAKERSQVGTRDATTFDVGPVIFNEISNRSSVTYEWFELRNKSDGEQNLKNRRISIVTAVGSDTWFFDVGDADLKIPAKGVLLFVFSDPSGDPNHPLAAGWNVAKNAANQVNGVNDKSPRYIVLKDDGKRKYNEEALGDDGFPEEFVLILRSRTHGDDVGKPTNIWDIAGYSTKLKVSADDAGFTNLWPLVGGVRNAELGNNKWVVGEVHRRQKDNIWGTSSTNYGRNDGNHHDDTAWRNVGYTGIGYKRSAAVGNENGGTPGYDNGASKSADAAALDPVIISEIMYDSSRRLPQWIEIMNTSTTVGVNLTNWAIDVVNHSKMADGTTEFEDAPLSTRIKFWEHDSPDGSFQLPPRQTMLIVSTGTRNDTTMLPDGRILNLRKGVGPKLLNPNGFYLRLVAKAHEGDAAKHQFGDAVGNLADPSKVGRRADAQSFADLAWELPSGMTDDGDRVSISRRTSDKVMDSSGMIEGNWIRSDMYAPVNNTRPATHYGTSSDIGSPGHVIGGALPVSLSKFRPERMKDTGQIVIRWITESELNNAGFNILRSEKRDGEFTKINTKLIAGQGTTSERTSYEYADTSAKPNVIYYYQIQDVSLDGQVTTLRTTHLRGNVTAVGKATTTWGDIKALQ